MINHTNLSKKEYFKLGLIFWSIAFTAVEVPLTLAFKIKLQNWQLFTDLIISCVFTYDFIDQFKKNSKNNTQFLSKKEKFFHFGQLFFEAFICIPFDILFWISGLHLSAVEIHKFLKMLRLLRIIKIFTILDKIALVPKFIKIQFSLLGIFIAIHILACIWITLGQTQSEQNLITQYIEGLYWTITTMTTVGYGDLTPNNNLAKLYSIIVMLGGVGFYGLVIGNVSSIINEQARYKEQTKTRFTEISDLMKYYHVDETLQHSVYSYYSHLFSKQLSQNDQKIISELPHSLKKELQVYMNIKLISNLSMFRTCSKECLKAVASVLQLEQYGPDEAIINIGDIGEEMYVIGHGHVDILSDKDQILASLNEGQFFGETALLKESKRNATVKAKSYCDLYKLSKIDFLKIIEQYPDLLKSIEEIISSH